MVHLEHENKTIGEQLIRLIRLCFGSKLLSRRANPERADEVLCSLCFQTVTVGFVYAVCPFVWSARMCGGNYADVSQFIGNLKKLPNDPLVRDLYDKSFIPLASRQHDHMLCV